MELTSYQQQGALMAITTQESVAKFPLSDAVLTPLTQLHPFPEVVTEEKKNHSSGWCQKYPAT